jgi:hypothetical protein
MKAGFDRVDARFDALQRAMLQFAGLVIVVLGSMAALIAS